MAADKIIRTDDGTGVEIATISFTEDSATRHAQQCAIVDATTPTQKLAVDSSGRVTVAAIAGALPAGTAAIGKLAANSGVDIGDVDVTSVGGTVTVGGVAAHSAAISGNPVRVGLTAIAHGANPTPVDAGEVTDWYANRHGIPFVSGPHMNVQSIEFTQADADGAQTDVALITVSAGTKIAVTQVQVLADQANTVETSVRIGIAAATLSAASTTPVAGIVLSHPGLVPGSGISRGDGMGILYVGGDGLDLRITISDPVGGNNVVVVSYFTIES